MVKKFMLVAALCMCTVSWGMEEEDAPTAPAVQQDALEKLDIPNSPDFKFFIEFKGEKIKISRQAFMRCKHFMDGVRNKALIQARELIFPWKQEALHLSQDYDITDKEIKFLVNILQTPNFDFSERNSDINLDTLYIMLALADFANADLPQLRTELATRIKQQVTDENYHQFLNGSGFLWDVIQNIPATLLATEELKCILCEPAVTLHNWTKSLIQLADGRLASGSHIGKISFRTWNQTSNAWERSDTHQGHTDWVYSLIQLADDRLASGSIDGIIKIWDISNPTNMQQVGLLNATSWVNSLIQLADGRLASGSKDNTIRIWDISNPTNMQQVGLLNATSWVNSLIQLADGRLASGSNDGIIRIWDISNPTNMQQVGLLNATRWVNSLIQLADGRLASGSKDNTIRIWDISNPTNMQQVGLLNATSWVNSLIQLADGRLASGSIDGIIRIWDISNPTNMQQVGLLNATRWVNSLIQLADGRLASGSNDGIIRIWDISNPTNMQQVGLLNATRWVESLIQLADGRLASDSSDGIIRIWDINLSLDQNILVNALRRFKSQDMWAIAKGSFINPDKQPLIFVTIFDNETLLNIFASLPDTVIQSLLGIHGVSIVTAAVEQLLENAGKTKNSASITYALNAIERLNKLTNTPLTKNQNKRIEQIKKRQEIFDEKSKMEQQPKLIINNTPNTPDFKFFIEFKGEKIPISRTAFMRCKHFMDGMKNKALIQARELIFPWKQEALHLSQDYDITDKEIKFLVNILQTPNFDFSKRNRDINLDTLYIMLALADFANADLPQLRTELATRIKQQVTDENYHQFLNGSGFLWDVKQNIPTTQLAAGEFKSLLCKPTETLQGHTCDLDLSLDQDILVNALRRFKLTKQSLSKTNGHLVAPEKQPLTFATIFGNETLLDIFASLPDTAIQSLISIHEVGIVQTAVEQLFKNMTDYLKYPMKISQEEVAVARIHKSILYLAKFLTPKEKTKYETKANRLFEEIELAQTIVRNSALELIRKVDNLLTELREAAQEQRQTQHLSTTTIVTNLRPRYQELRELIQRIQDPKIREKKQNELEKINTMIQEWGDDSELD